MIRIVWLDAAILSIDTREKKEEKENRQSCKLSRLISSVLASRLKYFQERSSTQSLCHCEWRIPREDDFEEQIQEKDRWVFSNRKIESQWNDNQNHAIYLNLLMVTYPKKKKNLLMVSWHLIILMVSQFLFCSSQWKNELYQVRKRWKISIFYCIYCFVARTVRKREKIYLISR